MACSVCLILTVVNNHCPNCVTYVAFTLLLAPEMTRTVAFSVYLKGSYAPPELEGNAVVSYYRPTGKHIVSQEFISLITPFKLLGVMSLSVTIGKPI